jgi:hypothetical protein
MALGVGVKVEVTDYVGTGVGLGLTTEGSEWYGRRVLRQPHFLFLHAGLIGVDDSPMDNADQFCSVCYLGYNDRKYRPPLIDRFRVGAQAFVPLVHLGLYVNFGELVDFFAGIAGLDPAEDDEIPKGTEVYRPRNWIKKPPMLREAAPREEPPQDPSPPDSEAVEEPGLEERGVPSLPATE